MADINIFEYAAKNKIRFPYRGMISTEDLYSLSVEDLDDIFKTLNKKLKAEKEESLLAKRSKESTELEIQIAIVKHIVTEKQQEALNRLKARERREQKQKIMAIMAEKDDVELRGKSKEELQKLLDELE